MFVEKNVGLAQYTSLNCGGPAQNLARCSRVEEIAELLEAETYEALWLLGYGTNSLISDEGLPGLTILLNGGSINLLENRITADAGVWWDDLVKKSVQAELWGIECLSGIPSSVGAAVTGNIAAYGQQISDRLESIKVFNTRTHETQNISTVDIKFSYRRSSLQDHPEFIVTSATFKLAPAPTMQLKYASAQIIAQKLNLNSDDLQSRQKIIIEARRKAGSLYDPNDSNRDHTAGSFFKNPEVSFEQAEKLAKFDETGKTLQRILEQNKLHGGSTTRASAAHVLLAAGFERGQTWGNVRLHPEHILKIENTSNATAQEIFNVAQSIKRTVQEKLTITLEPEVKFLGSFKMLQ